MRIEHQGYVEVQPVYQHAGYVSAALTNAYVSVWGTGVALTGVLLTVSLLLALRLRRKSGYVGAGLIVVLGMGACTVWGAGRVREAARAQAAIDMVEVMQRLEATCEVVEKWDADKDGPLTEERWRARWARGRGRDYELKLLNKRGVDGQRYRVISKPAAQDAKGPRQDIPSTWLGPDGLHSTPDDAPALGELLEEWHMTEGGFGRLHARKPRKATGASQ